LPAEARDILLSFTESRPVLGLTDFRIQWIVVALSPAVMEVGHEADHSPQFNAEAKNIWIHTSTPQLSSWPGA
jgi:hypothetical protein